MRRPATRIAGALFLITGGLAVTLMVGASAASAAPAYPTRPVKIIVSYAAGGINDIVGRLLAQKMTEDLGQRFFVENRPGANGNVASELAARAAPDGYTLEIASAGPHAINVSLYPHLPYDPLKDFAPIALVSWEASLLIVRPDLPATTFPLLIGLLKSAPQPLAYGTAGFGSTTHLGMELLKMMSGTSITAVAYKGASEVTQAVVTSQVDFAFNGTSTALPSVRGGTVRALAISSLKRSVVLPEVPAIAETLPGFEALAWHGLLAPAGTPPEVIDILATEVQKIVREPDVAGHMRDLGITPVGSTQAEFARFMADEIRKWADVVKVSGA
ncbi:MAG: tripartite tricarboxylate transporter substrate binding protein, partial [Alphaproteobacteria bacterium]|nr:tripartite tricarboxylate transporter substrate binding protein [Alphaproteobacteria bacterium]